jgi:hypothetical protein
MPALSTSHWVEIGTHIAFAAALPCLASAAAPLVGAWKTVKHATQPSPAMAFKARAVIALLGVAVALGERWRCCSSNAAPATVFTARHSQWPRAGPHCSSQQHRRVAEGLERTPCCPDWQAPAARAVLLSCSAAAATCAPGL